MKVIVVISKFLPEYTGAAFRTYNTYKRLRNTEDIEVEIITGGSELNSKKIYNYDEFKVTRIRSCSNLFKNNILAKVLSYLDAFQTIFLLFKKKYDLLHIIGTSPVTASAILYSELTKTPKVIEFVTAGASPSINLPGLAKLWKPKLKHQTILIPISKYLEKKCNEHGHSSNVWFRLNPVNKYDFFVNQSKSNLRKKYTVFREDDTILLMIAKFMPQKNQIFLIDVLSKLPSKYKLILAGPLITKGKFLNRDRQYFKRLKNEISAKNLEERVQLIPNFVDTKYYMNLSDIYLMPNLKEGFGTPLIEAIICDLPIVANLKVESFQEWIVNNENGLLVSLDANLWTEAILKINKLDKNKFLKHKLNIERKSSSDILDYKFINILNHLVNSNPKEIIKIENAFRN